VLGSLWADQRLLIRVFRRLGCAYCRGEAMILSNVSQQIKDAGIRMIGVGTNYGAQEFVGLGFWKGDFYSTPDYDVHKHIQGTKHVFGMGLGSIFTYFKTRRSMHRYYQALGGEEEWQKIPMNYRGTDEYYGSLLLVGPGNRLHYCYMQQFPGDFPGNDDIMDGIKAAEKRQPILKPTPTSISLTAPTDPDGADPETGKIQSVAADGKPSRTRSRKKVNSSTNVGSTGSKKKVARSPSSNKANRESDNTRQATRQLEE